MSVWLEAWTLPSSATFEKVVGPIPYTDFSFQRRYNTVGQGSLVIPHDYDRIDDICDPLNNVETLIRVFEDEKNTYSFFARVIDKTYGPQGTITIGGPGIEDELDKVLLYPWDWGDYDYGDGARTTGVTQFSDTSYGGDNILPNPNFESYILNEQQRLYHDYTSGDFTLTYDGQTTAAINWDASGADLEAVLENLNNIIDVTCRGSGTVEDPWVLEFIDPGQQNNPLVTVTNNMGGGTFFTIEEIYEGGKGDPRPWTKSFNPATNQLHGGYQYPDSTNPYANFYVGSAALGDPAYEGNGALAVGVEPVTAGDNYPGAQVIVNVDPGGFYHASGWFFSPQANSVSLVVRDLYENFIAKTTVSILANTWTELTLPTVQIPYGVDTVIYRAAVNNPDSTNDDLWIDKMELNEGLPATTAGQIVTNLWTAASKENRGTIMDWLVHDSFDGSLDSSGVAWTEPEISIIFPRGITWLQALERLANLGYEWKVEWNSTGEYYELLFYDPGNMGTDRTGDNFPRFAVPRFADNTILRKSSPRSNAVLIEGSDGLIEESIDATLISAYGRREEYVGDDTLADSQTLLDWANYRLDARRNERLGIKASVDETIRIGPELDADLGDTVNTYAPPDLSTQTGYRIFGYNMVGTANGKVSRVVDLNRYTHFEARGGTTSSATSDAVNYLLREFKALRRLAKKKRAERDIGPGLGVKGFTIRIAAADAYPSSKNSADYVCDGFNDDEEINQAITSLRDNDPTNNDAKGRILLSEGQFNTGAPILAYAETQIVGMSEQATIIRRQNSHNSDAIQTTHSGAADSGAQTYLRDFTLEGNKVNNTAGGAVVSVNNYAGVRMENITVNEFEGWDSGGSAGIIAVIGAGPFSTGEYFNVNVTNCDNHGFYLRTDDEAYFCQALNNGGDGLRMGQNGECKIIGGSYSFNTGWGIAGHDSQAMSTVVGVRAEQNTQGGIAVNGGSFDGHRCVVVGCWAYDNGSDGIRYGATAGGGLTLIASNVSVDNGGWGINRGSGGTSDAHVAANVTGNNTSGAINLGSGDTHAANREAPTGGTPAPAAGADSDAIHDNVAAEISAITAKATPTTADFLLIEDAADSDNKKRITIGNLPAAAPATHATSHHTGGGDAISHDSIDGVSIDDHHARDHAATHSDGGADEIDVVNLASGSATQWDYLSPDGSGGLQWAAPGKVGSGTITDTNSSVNVTHGLGATPSAVLVTPSSNELLWVTAIGATTFTVNRAGTSGGHTFSWRADY